MITKINRRHLIGVSLIICLLSFSPVRAQNYEVVPLPQSIEMQKGAPFVLDSQVQILATDELECEAEFLQQYLYETTGIKIQKATKREKKQKYIELSLSPKVTEAEGYVLTVNVKGLTIQGRTAAGVFYGIQTIRKAIPVTVTDAVSLPAVLITDAPRFGYRGMMLDCSRHFWSVDFVKKFIDLMALHNMNRFHWHLTDDQGWRIEIKKYPELTTIGSQRSAECAGKSAFRQELHPAGRRL